MTCAARQLDLLKGKRQKGTLPPSASELVIHCMVVDTFWRWRVKGWHMWHLASGEKRDAVTAKKLQRMGVRPGLPDLLLLSPSGEPHWLEIKSGKGKLTGAQEAFFALIDISGAPYATVTSFKDALNQLYAWGAVKARAS